MKKLFIAMLLASIVLIASGCGSSSESYTVDGIEGSITPAHFARNGEDCVKVAAIAQTGLAPEDFAAAYYSTCFEQGDVAHYIVNFSTNTTTEVRDVNGSIFVTAREYVDGEEHDYKEIGSGMVYSEYMLHPDTGELEKLR